MLEFIFGRTRGEWHLVGACALVASVSACGGRIAPCGCETDDAADSGAPDAAPGCAPSGDAAGDAGDAAPPAAFDCELILTVGAIEPTTCAVEDPVSHRVGHLRWRCGGGAAHLSLGDLVLDGTVVGDAIELSTCRDDPMSWLSGHFETVTISADLGAKKGALSYARASGSSCPKVYTDCGATGGVVLSPLSP